MCVCLTLPRHCLCVSHTTDMLFVCASCLLTPLSGRLTSASFSNQKRLYLTSPLGPREVRGNERAGREEGGGGGSKGGGQSGKERGKDREHGALVDM